MKTEAEVVEGLRSIFSEIFDRDDIDLRRSLTAKDVAGWDSFKQVELIIETEQRFGMRFTSAEVDGFRCLGDLIDVVAERGSLTVICRSEWRLSLDAVDFLATSRRAWAVSTLMSRAPRASKQLGDDKRCVQPFAQPSRSRFWRWLSRPALP